MFRILALPLSLYALAGCVEAPADQPGDTDTSDTGDTSDTSDTGDTSDTSDTGDTSDTDDTSDTGDTDDTDQVDDTSGPCVLTAAPTGPVRTTEPTGGEQITFTRHIEACVDDAGMSGQWWVEIRGGNGDLVCGYVAPFDASGAVTDACADCDEAFGAASFGARTLQASSNCGLFGWDDVAPFYEDGGTTYDYTEIGASYGASPQLYHRQEGSGTWAAIDPSQTGGSATVERTAVDFSDATRVRVAFQTSYTY